MATVDLLILTLLVLMGVLGFFQGFIVGALSLTGMALGAMLAAWVVGPIATSVAGGGGSTSYTPLFGLMGALVGSVLLSSGLQGLGELLRKRLTVREGVAVDRVLGAMLSVALGLGLVWITAAALMAAPALRAARPHVVQSRIVMALNTALPPAGPVLNSLARYDPLPAFHGPRITVGAPTGSVPHDPDVRAAKRGVVRVVGAACGFAVTGSGWVVAPRLVVTNAHVVAGQQDTAVEQSGAGERLGARVVHFDPDNDLALLMVKRLEADPIPMHLDAPVGASGAVLGFPEDGPFDARAARLGETREVISEDIYGRSPVTRTVVSMRGLVRHGNSGGPMVDTDGRVALTVFAATVGGTVRGGYGVPNEVVQQAVAALHGRRAVSTGPCVA